MKTYDATEQAYKNGYEAGKKDALKQCAVTREKLDVHNKLMGLIQRAPYIGCADTDRQYAVNWLMNKGVTVQECARPLEEWGEDYGDVLWWKFPIEEPPYVGSPLDENWPAYHTHWTPILMPQPPKGD